MPYASPPPEPVSAGPGYTVRRFRRDDAPGVIACVRRIYGDSYIHPDLYHPDRLVRLNATGELVSLIALDAAETVVGHYGLERPDLGPVAEEGEAMVLPEHRHHHLMEALRALLEEEAHRLDLTGLFGRAVTNHVFSQIVQERYGLRPCGISLGASPRTMHNMAEALPQRMSLLLAFKYLRPPARVVAHAPPEHQAICARIYEQLGLRAEFAEPAAPKGAGQVAVHFLPEKQQALIRVGRAGADTAEQIRRARRDLGNDPAVEVVFLELPLAQAGTPGLCRAAQEEGFFFSGLGPCFAADGDVLRLQWLKVDLDVALLQIETPFGSELLAYVARERERVVG
jgi:hypothetical protein